MNQARVQLPESWLEILGGEFDKEYMTQLRGFLKNERKTATVYPPHALIFNAFNHTPFDKVKAVILGQDPYHGVHQSHGLCFSVPEGVRPPPSLVNIYKELKSDLGLDIPTHGELTSWADEGVLLLNTTLTVREKTPKSHTGKGWEVFTDAVIDTLSREKNHLVFFLWGSHAQSKEALIDTRKHCVLKTTHPSPLSAYRGFLGSQPFSKCNKYLKKNGRSAINWKLLERTSNETA